MAHSHAAVNSTMAAGRIAAAFKIRLTVLVCVVLICGSFAAAAVLQMRGDRIHALAQADSFETRRAGDVAAAAAANLDRIAALGRSFADGETISGIARVSGVRNVTVFGQDGVALASSNPHAMIFPSDPAAAHSRSISAPSKMTFPYRGRIVAIDFDPHILVPERMLERAALIIPGGSVLIQDVNWTANGAAVRIANWPLEVRTSVDADSALAAWTGSLPLYLFVILGPALAGAALAFVFVREFEKRARSSQAIRSLRTTRPVETKLLVRLAHAERRAVEDARAKSEFIAHMSHELRTPLNAIIGFSEVIERGFYGAVGHPKYVEYAHDINEAGRSLHNKIGDILEFANIEAGRFPIDASNIDVSALAADVVGEHAGRAFSRRVDLQLGFSAAVEARADPQAVRRILTSLVTNALLYTQEGGIVRVEVHEEEAAAVVTVSDNGRGFTRAEAAAAGAPFRHFERAGAMTGVGMGLTIAMALARRMGGAVRIGGISGESTVAELRLVKV